MKYQCAENIHGTSMISNKTQANLAAVVAPQPTSFVMLITERQVYILHAKYWDKRHGVLVSI